ncbi:MAG TPA: hypothetical protein VFW44_07860 [Bryobacteraceae bacterium]|nr:hypothetical protein [Bryobacteraceae bacterium]
MLVRDDLKPWIKDALEASGGQASVIEVCRYVWHHHEAELRQGGDLFFTWQYDIRWAATKLRHEGIIAAADKKSHTPWRLAERNQ